MLKDHANFLCLSITCSVPTESLLRPAESVGSTLITYARGEGKACLCGVCDPSRTTGIQPTDTMLFKMTECCGSDDLHPASCHCFRPVTLYQLQFICCPLSACQRKVCRGCPAVSGGRGRYRAIMMSVSVHTWTVYVTVCAVLGFS